MNFFASPWNNLYDTGGFATKRARLHRVSDGWWKTLAGNGVSAPRRPVGAIRRASGGWIGVREDEQRAWLAASSIGATASKLAHMGGFGVYANGAGVVDARPFGASSTQA